MRKLILSFGGMLALVCLTMNPVYAQDHQSPADVKEQQAVFDEAATSDGNVSGTDRMLQDVKQKYNLKLYLDFMYEQSLGDNEETGLRETTVPTFSSNHTFLLVQGAPTDKLRVGFDVQFSNYYEIEYSPVPNLSFKVGKIFLPFGEFQYHPIYGGKVYSIDNDLFPNWFTDYGIAFRHQLLDADYLNLNYEVFVSNGFKAYSGGLLDMNNIGSEGDNNSKKAFGGRMKTTWFGRYNVTASSMYDHWSNDGQATLNLYALEFSTNGGIADLPVLRNIELKTGFLGNKVKNKSATEPLVQEYDAYGTHLELSTKPAEWLKIAFRAGEVDPNQNVRDKMDQKNYNIHSIFYLEKYLELWAIYQRNQEKYMDEFDNDYLALKVILVY
jgi:hypothetical protein